MKQQYKYFLYILCCQLIFSCATKNAPDPYIGEWVSFDKDLEISKIDTLYKIEYLDKSGKTIESFNAGKVVDLLSYRDNNGVGKQIKIYVPVDANKSKEGNLVFDYNDSIHIRLIITGEGDFYKRFKSSNEHRLKGFSGTWKMEQGSFSKFRDVLKIDSTFNGIIVNWASTPGQAYDNDARFIGNLLNISQPAIDGGVNASYFSDCDCITIGDNKYFRYNESDELFLGHWTNKNGEIRIAKNGDYYLVMTHQYQDYVFTFLTEANGNELKEPMDKYAQGKTYTKISFISPGVISDNGGETKYYNSEKHSRNSDYSFSNSNNTNQVALSSTTKSLNGKVGKLDASYTLTWNSDGTISGTYYYPNKPNTKYTLLGKDLSGGKIQLTEYTGNNVSANCNLTLEGSCYIGQMNNTDGRNFKMTICQ